MKILHIFPFTHFINDYLDGFKENVESETHVFWLYGGSQHLLEERNIDIHDKKNVVWDAVAFENFDKLYKMCDLFVLQYIPEDLKLLRLIWTCYLRERKPYIIVPWGRELCGTTNLYNGEIGKDVVYKIDEFKRMLITHCSYLIGIEPKQYDDNIKFPEILNKRFAFINALNGVRISDSGFSKDYAYVSRREKINLMVGHRGTYTSGHKSVLDFLEKYQNELAGIICPLSYGDNKYISEINELGRRKFSYKWHPVLEWVSSEKWMDFLKKNVDIAVFNNSTSEGANTIYTMICMGKKVFINPMNDVCAALKRIGAIYYEWNSSIQVNELLMPMELSVANHNNKVICEFFSLNMFRKRWHQLFKECISKYQLPEISIVLPVYNGERYLRESLDSILAQTFTNWELIIVDDCSTDSTLDIVYEYASKDCRIRVVHNEVNRKLPASLNIGFSVAKGKYFTWTSDDNIFLPLALEEMKNALDSNKSHPMVSGDMMIINEEGNLINRFAGYDEDKMFFDNCVGACFMYRRNAAEVVGCYDETKFLVEDYDYWLRLLSKCGSILHIQKILYYYRQHDNSLSSTRKKKVEEMKFKLLSGYLPYIMERFSLKKEYLTNLYYRLLYNNLLKDKEKFFTYVPELRDEITEIGDAILLFGAGNIGDRAFFDYENRVVAFIDNDERKYEVSKHGKSVLSLKEARKLYPNVDIMICVSYNCIYSIIRQLKENNVKEYLVYENLFHMRRG